MAEDLNDWPSSIKKLLELTGQSQKELAKIIGVEPVTVSRWISGKATPTGTADLVLRALLATRGVTTGAPAFSAISSILPLVGAIAGGLAVAAVMKKTNLVQSEED